ncbi:hypothetical protein NE237_032015 [Protea cynaroides]|uniref:Uncharacterized protein n=1 Tax=Protea cynaroides TaxID=273540 RepID=A0A9Q0R2Q0_9MAGN|nr:hypothetical protein NE237_032015 [Protea cynaroides]
MKFGYEEEAYNFYNEIDSVGSFKLYVVLFPILKSNGALFSTRIRLEILEVVTVKLGGNFPVEEARKNWD